MNAISLSLGDKKWQEQLIGYMPTKRQQRHGKLVGFNAHLMLLSNTFTILHQLKFFFGCPQCFTLSAPSSLVFGFPLRLILSTPALALAVSSLDALYASYFSPLPALSLDTLYASYSMPSLSHLLTPQTPLTFCTCQS